MNQQEIITKLRAPFLFREIEWKIQHMTQDKSRALVVPYADSRCIQNRLDEVVGVFNWRVEYLPWQEKSQLCKLSIYFAERNEWVSKVDGSQNSDFEPIKGGLSDAFKRVASVFGIARFLYQVDGVWCDIEAKGKSFAIKQDQHARLESAYNTVVAKLFGTAPPVTPSTPQSTSQTPQEPPLPAPPDEAPPAADTYKVHSVKPSGKSSQAVELIDEANGEVVTAYIKASDQSIKAGIFLRKVQIERKTSNYGAYNLVTAYEAA